MNASEKLAVVNTVGIIGGVAGTYSNMQQHAAVGTCILTAVPVHTAAVLLLYYIYQVCMHYSGRSIGVRLWYVYVSMILHVDRRDAANGMSQVQRNTYHISYLPGSLQQLQQYVTCSLHSIHTMYTTHVL